MSKKVFSNTNCYWSYSLCTGRNPVEVKEVTQKGFNALAVKFTLLNDQLGVFGLQQRLLISLI